MTLLMSSEFCARACAAVAASVVTPLVMRAMSGSAATVPLADTVIERRCSPSSAMAPKAVSIRASPAAAGARRSVRGRIILSRVGLGGAARLRSDSTLER